MRTDVMQKIRFGVLRTVAGCGRAASDADFAYYL